METHLVCNIAVIGFPNSGKSTFINNILNQRISAISKIRNTTKTVIRGILNYNDYQFIFNDTPGIISNTSRKQFIQKVYGVIKECDIILMLIDVSKNSINADYKLLDHIRTKTKDIIIVLSKVDKIRKDLLLPIIDRISAVTEVVEIIPLDLLRDVYKEKIVGILKKYATPKQKIYSSEKTSDSSLTLEQHLEELIRESLFNTYRDEIPHQLKLECIQYKNSKLSFVIVTKNNSQKKLVIGKNGNQLASLRKTILSLNKDYKVSIKTILIKVI